MGLINFSYFYRPQRSCEKVMFLHLSVSHSVHRGWGVGVGVAGGMHGRMHACHTCPLCHTHPLPCMPPCHARPLPCTPPRHTHTPAMHAPPRILRDAVNERAVHIILECILVLQVIKYDTLVGLRCKA